MILVIDTSGPRWSVAWGDRTLIESTARPDLPSVCRDLGRPDAVAVATGPGSFTGLRVGVSFGLGLAIGWTVPILALPSLELLAARAEAAATAVLEAGRGRVYYLVAGGRPALGEVADVPARHPLVANVLPRTEASLVAARHRQLPPHDQRDFAAAAAKILETAREVAYGSLEIEYMQSFSAPR
jgi:tRNA threonylcarbamoyl adenosine modification protein YeaZ